MSLFRSTSVYTVANGAIAIVGFVLTVALGRQLGPDGFGVWASFFAAQNIWAGLGFMRLETRLASCTTTYQANRIIAAGFFAGMLVSTTLAAFLLVVIGSASHLWLAVLSGFGLSVFDSLSQRNAFEGRQQAVLRLRCVRVLLPLVVALAVALVGGGLTVIITVHGGVCVIVAFMAWGRWITPRRWWKLCVDVIRRHRYGLLPSLIMCLLNGIWINGLTPALNHFATPALAGQFAMVQRLVGGALGLLSTAITLVMLKRDFAEVHWPAVCKVLMVNVIVSVCFCILLAIPLFSVAGRWLGAGWTVAPSLYWAACAFLVSSFAIGAISIIAVRLRDEWFLALWQFAALLCWLMIYALMPPEGFVIPALWLGSAMYVLLGLRWRHLAISRGKE